MSIKKIFLFVLAVTIIVWIGVGVYFLSSKSFRSKSSPFLSSQERPTQSMTTPVPKEEISPSSRLDVNVTPKVEAVNFDEEKRMGIKKYEVRSLSGEMKIYYHLLGYIENIDVGDGGRATILVRGADQAYKVTVTPGTRLHSMSRSRSASDPGNIKTIALTDLKRNDFVSIGFREDLEKDIIPDEIMVLSP